MCRGEMGFGHYLTALSALVLCLPSVRAADPKEVVAAQLAAEVALRTRATVRLTIPAPAGAVVVRGDDASESLQMVQNVAGEFPARDKLHVALDDHAFYGRFCDDDNPFHVVIEKGARTAHDQWCLRRRFPAGTPQPGEFVVGQFRVLFVVNRSNPIHSLDFSRIRKALSQPCKGTRWRDVGGAGTAAVRCYGMAENTWSRQLIRDKCMTRWRDLETPGGRELQRLGFRDDLVACENAKEVIAKVRKDRNGLGFFAIGENLTDQMLRGVKVLSIAVKQDDEPVAPTLETVIEGTYPLSEPVFLYVHPNAPKEAWDFCRFATGPEAAKIVKESGLWPEYDLEQICGKQRLAELRRGEGAMIRVCDLTNSERLLNDLAGKFIKAKAAVRLSIQQGGVGRESRGGGANDTSIEAFLNGGSELVFVGQPMAATSPGQAALTPTFSPGERATDSSQSPIPSPQSLSSILLGHQAVGIVVHPKNVLEALPLNELQSILSGEIKQWPAANGAAGTMHVHGLPHSDQMTQLLKDRLGGKVEKELNYKVAGDTAKVVLAVAKDRFAIGFVKLSQLSPDEKSVKLVPITAKASVKDVKTAKGADAATTTENSPSGNEHSYATLASFGLPEDYPLARTFVLYVSPNASETARDFAKFLTPEHCAETLSDYSILPSSRVDRPTKKQEPAEATAAAPAATPPEPAPSADVASKTDSSSPEKTIATPESVAPAIENHP